MQANLRIRSDVSVWYFRSFFRLLKISSLIAAKATHIRCSTPEPWLVAFLKVYMEWYVQQCLLLFNTHFVLRVVISSRDSSGSRWASRHVQILYFCYAAQLESYSGRKVTFFIDPCRMSSLLSNSKWAMNMTSCLFTCVELTIGKYTVFISFFQHLFIANKHEQVWLVIPASIESFLWVHFH